ncbi:MAG: hypothetical protein AAGE84_26360 [Cyanobacteria bacterium P01_G01_bin.39]
MNHKYPKFSPWLSQSTLIVITLLLPIAWANAGSTQTSQVLAQSSTSTDEQIQSQIEAEADQFFSRTLIQFNLIILVTLALLTIAAIALQLI